MSNRSLVAGGGGSVRQPTPSSGVKLAGEDFNKDKMYEPKHTKRLVRVLTVVAYVFSVSLAAIMLSVYYVFLWNPRDARHPRLPPPTPPTCQPVNPAMAQMQPSFSPLQKTDEITLSILTSTTESPLYQYITQGRTVVTTLQTQQLTAKVPTLTDT